MSRSGGVQPVAKALLKILKDRATSSERDMHVALDIEAAVRQ
jgi:hypothetical protein